MSLPQCGFLINLYLQSHALTFHSNSNSFKIIKSKIPCPVLFLSPYDFFQKMKITFYIVYFISNPIFEPYVFNLESGNANSSAKSGCSNGNLIALIHLAGRTGCKYLVDSVQFNHFVNVPAYFV